MAKPPGLFSPRWWRAAWLIVRQGVAYRLDRAPEPPARSTVPAANGVGPRADEAERAAGGPPQG